MNIADVCKHIDFLIKSRIEEMLEITEAKYNNTLKRIEDEGGVSCDPDMLFIKYEFHNFCNGIATAIVVLIPNPPHEYQNEMDLFAEESLAKITRMCNIVLDK